MLFLWQQSHYLRILIASVFSCAWLYLLCSNMLFINRRLEQQAIPYSRAIVGHTIQVCVLHLRPRNDNYHLRMCFSERISMAKGCVTVPPLSYQNALKLQVIIFYFIFYFTIFFHFLFHNIYILLSLWKMSFIKKKILRL